MSDAVTATATGPSEGTPGAATPETAEAFAALDSALSTVGPAAMLDLLVRRLDESQQYRPLLDALLLKARHELGLPPIQAGALNDVPEPLRSKYEERYVAAVRVVGGKFLDSRDVPAAWPYFRAIGEPEPVALALDSYNPGDDDDTLGAMIDVAFNQGANPRRGFELILKHYGTCSAVTAFEHLPRDEATRTACADAVVRQLHDHLVANLRSEIAQRGQPLPRAGAPIADLLAGNDWLFADDAYHIDVSHLGAAVRMTPLLSDPATLALGLGLTDYGRKLSPRHVYEAEPPFENTYEDHGIYLRALLGREVEAAIAHFRAKLEPADVGDEGEESGGRNTAPAQVLVGLLARLNRLDEAIEVAAEQLAGYPDAALFCPSLAALCQRAGRPGRLAQSARTRGDLVQYAASALEPRPSPRAVES